MTSATKFLAEVAQLVERRIVAPAVAGSIPVFRPNTPLTQLDRVSGFEPEGWEFKSLTEYQIHSINKNKGCIVLHKDI